jgi:O-antigen ligase
MPDVVPRDDAEAPWVVGRLDLWRAAMQLFASHPLLGVGPDNFRHLYGSLLGLEAWDERVQANNVYLELLADLGALGLGAFLWVLASPASDIARSYRKTSRDERIVLIGVLLSATGFLVHGLLDSFLTFTPIVALLWLMLGVLLAQNPHVSGR